MIKKMYETLEFNKVLNILEEHALSEQARSKIRNLGPYLSETEVARHLSETTEAKSIMECYGNPPISGMIDLDKGLSLLGKGTFLMPEQLGNIALFLTACRRLKSYLKKAESTFTSVSLYGNSMYDLSEVEDEINRAVRGGQLDDRASPKLADIRRKIENAGMQVKSKLDSLLKNNKIWFSESFVTVRNGHYTLPVKREYKNSVSGTVIDISQSGGTYFIEPSAARKLQDEINILHIEEENEVRRILYMLTSLVEEHLSYININIEAMEIMDFVFAKAKLSIALKALPLPVSVERKIVIKAGRHPLLKAENVVPLDFNIGNSIGAQSNSDTGTDLTDIVKGVIITGPNTGGKTVALKTIGLLSLMAQSGLHVPAEDGCFTMNNYVLCDIGDGQSITENLSTFSSHMTNIIQILKLADDQSLVLLDELGSGTDPAEGMGLAVAILEELSGKSCLFVATTHYPEIKEYAKTAPGLVNARMAFDRQSLLPLYQLEIGEAGESCALFIAKRLGLPQKMIERASLAAYGSRVINKKALAATDLPAMGLPVTDFTEKEKAEHFTGNEDNNQIPRKVIPHIEKRPSDTPRSLSFNIGDSVMVYPQKMIAIVYQKANEKGEIGVQLKNKNKLLVSHKRIKLHVPASELYPENYDFSIVFDSIENRKKRHDMDRKHQPGLMIETGNE